MRTEGMWTAASVLLGVCLALGGCSPQATPDDNANANDNANTNVNVNTNENSEPAQTFTVTFEGDGGATPPRVTDFEFNGARFSGGLNLSLGQPDLYGSESYAYRVLEGTPVIVEFDSPVGLLELFFVDRGGIETVLTAFDGNGALVGTVAAAASGSGNDMVSVDLSAAASRVEIVHTGEGDGWIDDFTFGFAE